MLTTIVFSRHIYQDPLISTLRLAINKMSMNHTCIFSYHDSSTQIYTRLVNEGLGVHVGVGDLPLGWFGESTADNNGCEWMKAHHQASFPFKVSFWAVSTSPTIHYVSLSTYAKLSFHKNVLVLCSFSTCCLANRLVMRGDGWSISVSFSSMTFGCDTSLRNRNVKLHKCDVLFSQSL